MIAIQKSNKLRALVGVCAAAFGFATAPAFASVTVDDAGFGFIGKGDIQLAFDLNNKQLQDCVAANCLQFVGSLISEETTWECFNSKNEKTQERSRTVTSVRVAAVEARVKNQVTGFNLNGWAGTAGEPVTEGPNLESCPAGKDWSFVAGSTSTSTVGGAGDTITVKALLDGVWVERTLLTNQ